MAITNGDIVAVKMGHYEGCAARVESKRQINYWRSARFCLNLGLPTVYRLTILLPSGHIDHVGASVELPAEYIVRMNADHAASIPDAAKMLWRELGKDWN